MRWRAATSVPTSGLHLRAGTRRGRLTHTAAHTAAHTGRIPAMEPMAVLFEQGMLLESACGPIPNVAELVAGEPIRGSWWGHASSHDIFEVLNALADSPDVVRTRLVSGKVTLIHRRLWPALIRLADRLPVERLASIHQDHTATGAHQKLEQPFPGWVPKDVQLAAKHLSRSRRCESTPDRGCCTPDWVGAEPQPPLTAARRRRDAQQRWTPLFIQVPVARPSRQSSSRPPPRSVPTTA